MGIARRVVRRGQGETVHGAESLQDWF
jgi:hypothetical protein